MPTKRNSATKPNARPSTRRAKEAETVARAIQDFLELLAPILFAQGITPAAIAGLAKNALVASAAGSSRMSTGRVNQSKVAAVTGLSRAEVRRRLVEPPRLLPPTSRSLDRSARVAAGWLRDSLFLDRNGKPKTLPLRSGASSFAELVRLHSGDIPPRVVLEQLKDRGMVRITANGVSLKSKPQSLGGTPPATLLDVIPYIRALLEVAVTDNARLAYAQRVDVIAENNSQTILLTERVVRALAATAAAISSLPTLGENIESTIERTKLTVALTVTSKSLSKDAGKRTKNPS